MQACPVRFYYEKNEPVIESDRYAICKQLSYHLGQPLEADAIWDEVLIVRPKTDPALREFMDICIASCKKSAVEAGGPDRCDGGLKEARHRRR